jgi:hypothetical protein
MPNKASHPQAAFETFDTIALGTLPAVSLDAILPLPFVVLGRRGGRARELSVAPEAIPQAL